jgi:adenine-specific DNA-methyltransferase
LFPANPNGRPREKKFRADLTSEFTSIPTIVDNVFTSEGTSEIRDIFGAQIFDFPKPSKLIRQFVEQAVEGCDFVLDFFAGSGPAGQAVMDLNKEDNGNRKFILVQLPELTDEKSEAFKAGYKKISDITIERNKRVIDRITQEQTEKQQQGLFEQGQKPYQPGFKTYSLVKSHFPRVEFQPDPEQNAEENIALLKQYIIDKEATLYSLFNEADIFDEVMLKNGFQLNFSRESQAEFTANSVYRVTDGHKTALVCLDAELNDTTVAALSRRDESIAPEGAPSALVKALT